MVDGSVSNARLIFEVGGGGPLLPYLFGCAATGGDGHYCAALLVGGMFVGRLTGRPPHRPGLRQLGLGGFTVLVTYAVARLVGNPVS